MKTNVSSEEVKETSVSTALERDRMEVRHFNTVSTDEALAKR